MQKAASSLLYSQPSSRLSCQKASSLATASPAASQPCSQPCSQPSPSSQTSKLAVGQKAQQVCNCEAICKIAKQQATHSTGMAIAYHCKPHACSMAKLHYLLHTAYDTPLYPPERPSITFPEPSVTHLQSAIGGTVIVRCEAEGIPTPTVTLSHGNEQIPSESTNPSVAQKTLVVTAEVVGPYICIASATFVLPNRGTQTTKRYRTIFVEVQGTIQNLESTLQ